MSSSRIQQLNKQAVNNGKYVLFLMQSIRTRSSPSFAFASKLANNSSVPVLALYIYIPDEHNLAQRCFLLQGIDNLKRSFDALGTPFLPIKMNGRDDAVGLITKLSNEACEVVIDAAYLRQYRDFEESIADVLSLGSRKLTKVEGNVAVPVQLVSKVSEFGARTIRPKVWHNVKNMLSEKWSDIPEVKVESWKSLVSIDVSVMDIAKEMAKARKDCGDCAGLTGGEDAAEQILETFVNTKLSGYGTSRNVPNSSNQSMLSPYLHFGMINVMEVIRKINSAKAPKGAKDAYLEELVVRRELSHNFVYYNRDTYDSLNCLPDWAKKTMQEHVEDKRDYVYTARELEEGRTHDPYWNAAQFELMYSHKMHGYMRMYWAKKVIEWSKDYQSAYDFLIEQNDKYELDGRDPNGFCGVVWNFGMHDRAHAERPVFGKLRYMNADGLRRKFKTAIEEYVKANYKLAGRKVDAVDGPPPKKKIKMK